MTRSFLFLLLLTSLLYLGRMAWRYMTGISAPTAAESRVGSKHRVEAALTMLLKVLGVLFGAWAFLFVLVLALAYD